MGWSGHAPAPPAREAGKGTPKTRWRDQVIAESDRTLEVGGYRYFPRETVRMDLLLVAPKTQSDLICPNGVCDGEKLARRFNCS